MYCNIDNFISLLKDGYSFRFNSMLENENEIYFADEDKLKALNLNEEMYDGLMKLATVSYKHLYLCNFLEFGLEEGLDKNIQYAKEKLEDKIKTWK